MRRLQRIRADGNPLLVLALIVLVQLAEIGLVLLPGGFYQSGSVTWWLGFEGLVLLFIARGSRIAWWIAAVSASFGVVATTFALSIVGRGARETLELLGIGIFEALTLWILVSPSLRLHTREESGQLRPSAG